MQFRYDIQSLRGYAVFLILLFHAGIGGLGAGYLGVDIFFVISGFLITTLLLKHMQQGNFSFKDFYFRRARRLLPAAYTTFFFTIIGSSFLLTSNEAQDFRDQLIGAITFTSNFVLYDQADYFGGDAKLKPLLHIWSLAIEEQFYLFLPITLLFCPRNFRTKGTLILLGISLIICIFLTYDESAMAFYMPHSRAWELLIGSLGAIYLNKKHLQKYYKYLFWPALASLVIVPAFPLFPDIHPGPDAFIVCIATLIVILRQHRILNDTTVSKAFSKVGDYSYSLYLVHWPLFAFANNAYLSGEIPIGVRIGLLAASIILAMILYHAVERPIHQSPPNQSKKITYGLALSSVLLVALVFSSLNLYPIKDYEKIRESNKGLTENCDLTKEFELLKECRTGDKPEILIWGDSHAMHLVSGIESQTLRPIVQLTKSACSPFIGLSYFSPPKYNESWAKGCITFNDSVFEYLKETPSIEMVILSSPFNKNGKKGNEALLEHDGDFERIAFTQNIAIDNMRLLIKDIQAMGKKVIVISSPPKASYDIGICLERKETGKRTLGPYKDCPLYSEQNLLHTYDFLAHLQSEVNVNVILLKDYLCKDGICPTMIDGKFLYRDSGHLSYEGSVALAKHIGLMDLIIEKAK